MQVDIWNECGQRLNSTMWTRLVIQWFACKPISRFEFHFPKCSNLSSTSAQCRCDSTFKSRKGNLFILQAGERKTFMFDSCISFRYLQIINLQGMKATKEHFSVNMNYSLSIEYKILLNWWMFFPKKPFVVRQATCMFIQGISLCRDK